MSSNTPPLIVQSDGSLLLDVHSADYEECRNEISAYAELEKSPEHVHTYRITAISLWNAAELKWSAKRLTESLRKWSRYAVPENVFSEIRDVLSRWGKVRLVEEETSGEEGPASVSYLRLHVDDPAIFEELKARKSLSRFLSPMDGEFRVRLVDRGTIKSELINIGFPVVDLVPFTKGDPLKMALRKQTLSGEQFFVRNYQNDAVKSFIGNRTPGSGHGTIVMPCGSGKTVVGMTIMSEVAEKTLILTTNVAAVHQWRNELLDKTTLNKDDIAEYTGAKKNIGPVTIATYQVLIWKNLKTEEYPHFDLFRENTWGLIIYDEVHLLPAAVFRVTAEIQSVRRLGLTATLIREDGGERNLFSLVGPKRYDVPWKQMEESGWIAEAHCVEIRIDLPDESKIPYAMAESRRKIRIAAENSKKIDIAIQLVNNHQDDHILVIGQYIQQLETIARRLKVPLITGKTPNPERERIYDNFRQGKERVIVVSKVANFAIDLPDASTAIQLSGAFGSRQEEAQRLGRILRPKKKNSSFYSLVTRGTIEENFALNRQRFLTEQGYKYQIDLWDKS